MSLLQRLSGSLAQSLRLAGRQFAQQQGASFHLSATLEARKRKAANDEADSDEDASPPNPAVEEDFMETRDVSQLLGRFDTSFVRNPDGSMPEGPVSEHVEIDDGLWDVHTFISPALAAALEEAPDDQEGADELIRKFAEHADKLEAGKEIPGDGPASDEDLLQVAEAIDLYFQASPEENEEVDGFEEFDRDVLEMLGETIKEVLEGGERAPTLNMAPPGQLPWEVLEVDEEMPMVNWGVDLTEGKAIDPWKNALLSEDAKQTMWQMHSKEGWEVPDLAQHFGIRQQRVMAILALKEREQQAREAGQPLYTQLAEFFEDMHDAHETRGSGEKHHVVLPSYPNYKELTEEDADRLAALLESRLGKKFDDIEPEDITPEIRQELLTAAGIDKEGLEDELAAKEEEHLVAEFRRSLEYNLGKTGTSLSRSSRKKHPPKRPEGGWHLLVQPLGKAARSGERHAYVAAPDGSQRELTADELLMLERQQPRPRSKIL